MQGSRDELNTQLKELIEVPLVHPELYGNIGIQAPKAVLLYGVTGSGKTYLIKEAAKNAGARVVPINLDSISGEELLKHIELDCNKSKPIVFYLVMHNPEAIDKDVINTLAKLLDGEYDINFQQVVFAGSSVRPILPTELTRPGRFDQELYIGLPDTQDRLKILKSLLTDTKLDERIDIQQIANSTRGCTPADLIQVIKTAARYAIRRVYVDSSDDSIEEKNIQPVLKQTDLEKSAAAVEPTVYKEFGLEEPNVAWENIAGHDTLKSIIKEKIVEPLSHKEYYDQIGISQISGILLHGPPGNGKTTLAKGIASAIKGHFLYINSSDLLGAPTGEKQLSQLFQVAQEVQPTVLFFDEVDSFLIRRDKAKKQMILLVNEFLTLMDGSGMVNKPLVIAATNFLDKIDPAATRPGRLELKLLVAPPDKEERKQIFQNFTKSMKLAETVDFGTLAKLTDPTDNGQYSISDIKQIVREAGILGAQDAISKNLNPSEVVIKMDYFKKIIQTTQPSNKLKHE